VLEFQDLLLFFVSQVGTNFVCFTQKSPPNGLCFFLRFLIEMEESNVFNHFDDFGLFFRLCWMQLFHPGGEQSCGIGAEAIL
jgi:hypothetical protein